MAEMLTTSALARIVGRSVDWVRQHANSGALPHSRSSAGHRLFGPDAVAKARDLIDLAATARRRFTPQP